MFLRSSCEKDATDGSEWDFFFKRKYGNGWERLAGNTIISIFHRLKYGLHVSFLQREHGKKKRAESDEDEQMAIRTGKQARD